MATNLRLRPEAERAVREEAERSGRSQQDVIREAIDRHLHLTPDASPSSDLERLIAEGVVRRPRSEYRRPRRRLALPAGSSAVELLDREDRI